VGEPFEGHSELKRSVTYSGDGSRLVHSDSTKIRVQNPRTGQITLEILTYYSLRVSSVAFSSSGAFIASGSWDGTIRVYDAHTSHEVFAPLYSNTLAALRLIYSPDGTRLYSCSPDGTVHIWNIKDRGTPDTMSTTLRFSAALYPVRYSHSRRYVVSGS
jgi:WD40 repeat protein